MLKFKKNHLTKILAIISAICVVFSMFAAIPFVIKAQNSDKMIVVSPNKAGETKYANAFIPLDFLEVDGKRLHSQESDEYYYFKLSFKLKLLGDKMPIVGIVRYAYWTGGGQSEFSYVNNNQESHDDKILSSSYDEQSLTYTAIIKMWINPDPDTGNHTALTIGNMEHNNNWHKENNFSAHFAFTEPELYAYNTSSSETFGDNLLAPITEDNFTGDIYKHSSNGYKAADALLKAPSNKWSIDTTSSLIELADIPEGYFDVSPHSYEKVPAVAATKTENGVKMHYICKCGDCDGKYYLDKNGKNEVSYEDLITTYNVSGNMFEIKPNVNGERKYANVFIPLDFLEVDGNRLHSQESDEYYYFKLSFKLKLINGKMPIVGIVRYAYWNEGGQAEFSYVNNNQESHDDKLLYSTYDESTLTYTALIRMWINPDPKSGVHTALTIGNMEHNDSWYKENSFDAHFAFTAPELYAYDTMLERTYGENLIADINDSTFTGDVYKHPKNGYKAEDALLKAPANKWSIDTTASLIEYKETPANFFHIFKKVPRKSATETETGLKEHYICECSDCEGKYYLNQGLTEVKYEDLVIPVKEPQKMFVIKPASGQSYSNVFIPLNFLEVDGKRLHSQESDEYYYFKLSFKLKLMNDKMPIVGIVRYAYWNGGGQSEFSYVNNNQESHDDALLTSSYNEETMEYTAIIKMWINPDPDTGNHTALTIGNMEHNDTWFKESNFDTYFAFTDPELFAYDTKNAEIYGENLIAPITDENFTGNTYTHLKNGYKESDALLKAPSNKWSIDTTASLISLEEIPDNYFKPSPHKFVKVNGVSATKDTEGLKEHYVCECEECGLKYFLDKGLTEVTYEELILPALGEDKMIIVSPNASGGTKTANVFIPLNFRQAGDTYFDSRPIDKYYYFKLTFKLKILGDSMPIVGMMRYNPYNNLGSWSEFNRVNNNQLDHDDKLLYSEYDPETMIYTAVVKMWIDDIYSSSPTGAHSAITIGNMEHNNSWRSEYNFDASFAFCDPQLYAYNTETGETYGENLMTGIHDVTFNSDKVYQHLMNDYAEDDNLMAAPANMWSIDGQKNMITLSEIPENYFVPTKGTPHMVIFDGKNDSEGKGRGGKILQKVSLEAGKKYKLSYNVKYASTGLEGDKIGGQLEYNNGSEYLEVSAVKTESKTEYKEIFDFTMPEDATNGSNFRFSFNYSSAFTSGYMANFELYEVDDKGEIVGNNLFKNGDFSIGGISSWNKQGESYRFIITEIPENYFSKTTPHKSQMAIYRNTSDFAQIYQMPTLKPNTKYEFKHTGLHTDYVSDKKPYGIVYLYYKDDKGNNVNSSIPNELVEKTETENSVSMVFTTYETLRTTGDNNSLIRVYMRTDSAGFWGNFELYELDKNGKRVGNNLFLNPDFACGTEVWTLQGDYNIRFAEIPSKDFFDDYKEPDEMMYATGKKANQTYSASLNVSANKKYYYTGEYVNMNSAGVTPQIEYLTKDGEYKTYTTEMFYDSNRYYFEMEFTAPEDALVKNGKVSIRALINNTQNGKGYFTNLMLTEDGTYVNLLTKFSYANKDSFKKMPYDAGVFVFYYDDEKFDDGDWSGELSNNEFNITTGDISGRVTDANGMGLKDCTIKLVPSNKTVKTDEFGSFEFEGLNPGKYKLYLVENKDSSLYCMEVEVKRGISSLLPNFCYTVENIIVEDTNVQDDSTQDEVIQDIVPDVNVPVVDDLGDESVSADTTVTEYGIMRGFYYTTKGKTISGATIYLRNHGSTQTDANGMFMFENVIPGEYEVYTILADGSEYIFRTVTIEPYKGVQIKVMEPAAENEEGFNWIIVIIIAVAVFVLADAAIVALLIIKKEKIKIK